MMIGTSLDMVGSTLGVEYLRDIGYQLRSLLPFVKMARPYGMILEMDSNGRIINSLHSPDYKTTLLSEVREVPQKEGSRQRILYLGSVMNPYIGKLVIDE